jgi:hypothetical protein
MFSVIVFSYDGRGIRWFKHLKSLPLVLDEYSLYGEYCLNPAVLRSTAICIDLGYTSYFPYRFPDIRKRFLKLSYFFWPCHRLLSLAGESLSPLKTDRLVSRLNCRWPSTAQLFLASVSSISMTKIFIRS